MAEELTLDGHRIFERKLAGFAEDVYALEPNTHLYKFLWAALEYPGAGAVKKAQAAARLGETLSSTWFGDLDAFFGAMVGIERLSDEQYGFDPWRDQLTIGEWDEVALKDALYRGRLSLMLQAITRGGTVEGVEMAAESACGRPCWVYECWRIESGAYTTAGRLDRAREFVIVPDQEIEPAEERAVYKAVALLQPVNSVCTVNPLGPGVLDELIPLTASSPSEYFETVRVVRAPELPGRRVGGATGGGWVVWGGETEARDPAHLRVQQETRSINESIQSVTALRNDESFPTRVGAAGIATSGAPSITVDEVTGAEYAGIEVGQIIGDELALQSGGFLVKIEDEIMLVTDREPTGGTGFTYLVERAQEGTTAAAHPAAADVFVQYQAAGGAYSAEGQQWGAWTDFERADSPDNFPEGKYSGDQTRFDESGTYLFPYESQQEYVDEVSAYVESQGGEINGAQWRLPAGGEVFPTERTHPEYALAGPEMQIDSSYYPTVDPRFL